MTYYKNTVLKFIGLSMILAISACGQQIELPPIMGGNQTGVSQPQVPEMIDGQPINEGEGIAQTSQPVVGGSVKPGEAGQVALLIPLGSDKPNIAALAMKMQNAAKLAVQNIRGATIDLRVYDTAGTAETARNVASLAISDGADLIVGPLFSHSVEAVSAVAAPAGITTIAFSTDTAVANASTFLIGFLPETEIKRVVSFASGKGANSLALLAPQTPYGEVAIAAIHQASAQAGSELKFIQRYVKDFQGIEEGTAEFVNRFKETRPLAVLIPDSGQSLQTVGSFLAYKNISPRTVKFLGTGLWDNPDTLKEASLQGGWFASSDPKLREIFAQKYESVYGDRPEQPIIGLAFDAVAAAGALMVEAAKANDSYPFTPKRITDPTGFAGVNGIFRFKSNGLNERGLAVMEVGASSFNVVDPAPSTFTGPVF